MFPPEEYDMEPYKESRKESYEEARSTYLELAYGVELKVDALVRGWMEPGGKDYPPDGEETVEVTDVSLLAFGKVVDLTDLYNMKLDQDLMLAVAEAVEIIL